MRSGQAPTGAVGVKATGRVSNPTMKFDTRSGWRSSAGQVDVGQSVEEAVDHARDLGAGQAVAEAEVGAEAEGDVIVGWRRMSKVSGSANTVSSRLADG